MARQQFPVSQIPDLPPQLAEMLPMPAGLSVSRLCEMAPGIAFSAELLDDMLGVLVVPTQSAIELASFGGVIECAGLPTGFANGMKIYVGYHVFEHRRVKNARVQRISANVRTKCPGQDVEFFVGGTFTCDRLGMRAAIEFTQRSVNNLKRKGFCPCWESEPSVKRICIAKTGLCAKCIVKIAHE